MFLSASGTQMSGRSGIRTIMDDIAAAGVSSAAERWVNLSPGNPSLIAEAVDFWQRLVAESLTEDFTTMSCRYGPSRGTDVLVDAIVDYFSERYGWAITPAHVVVGAGSQQLCFAAATMFTGPGEHGLRRLVLPSLPDYAGYQGLSLSPGGLVGVESTIVTNGERGFRYQVDAEAVRRIPDMGMMLVSTPGNPTGRALDIGEIDALVAIAEKRDAPLVLDHAYGQPFPLVVDAPVAPVRHPSVINTFTFSKAGLPGERLGFAIGEPELITPLVSYLANSALHAPQLVQAAAARALRSRQIDTLSEKTISPYYRGKRRYAEQVLHERMPAGMSWRLHSAPGGMFCWLWIDHDWFDDLAVYEALKRRHVFVVPGRHFFTAPSVNGELSDHARRCVRLSLSADEATIAEGLTRFSTVLLEQRREHTGAKGDA